METQEEKRTGQQNKAFHKFFGLLSDELNTKGLDMKVVLKPSHQIWWTSESVKENLWKPVMKAMYNIESTTELTTSQVSKVYEQIMQILGEKFGVNVEFPARVEDLIVQDDRGEVRNLITEYTPEFIKAMRANHKQDEKELRY